MTTTSHPDDSSDFASAGMEPSAVLPGQTGILPPGWVKGPITAPPSASGIVRNGVKNFRASRILLIGDVLAVSVAIALENSGAVWFEIATGLILILTLSMWGLYRSHMTLSALSDSPRLVASAVMAVALAATGAALLDQKGLNTQQQVFGLALVGLLVLFRVLSYALVRRKRRKGQLAHRTVILGAGQVANMLGGAMCRDQSFGCELLGFVDADPAFPGRELPAPVLGGWQDISKVITDNRVERVVIAFSLLPEAELVPIIQACDRADVEIFVIPRLFEMTANVVDEDEVDGIPVHKLHRGPFQSPTWILKRVMDVSVAGLALVLLSPLLALLALLNRVVDGPGIIFRQIRVGIDGGEIEVLKFRSMRPASEEESATNWNIKHDDRVSWFGKILRSSSLDELPQLWNIVRGDMSLVGPRPERPHFVAEFSDLYLRYDARHRVPCGLTGWAQIHGLRGDTSIGERVRYDNYYIQNWSLWLDFKIILLTATSFMKGSG